MLVRRLCSRRLQSLQWLNVQRLVQERQLCVGIEQPCGNDANMIEVQVAGNGQRCGLGCAARERTGHAKQ